MIRWSETMSVGDEVIDHDHRELISIVSTISANPSLECARRYIPRLQAFAVEHFCREEAILFEKHVNDAEWHRSEHRIILERLEHIAAQLHAAAGGQDGVLVSLMSLLLEWILGHILYVDAHMGPHADQSHNVLATSAQHAAAQSAVEGPCTLHLVRALLVDDDACARTILQRILTHIGVGDVKDADCGQTALGLVQVCRPNLVICDIGMSPMNGIELAQTIRKEERAYGCDPAHIIFVTTHSEEQMVIEARKVNADGYFIKPVTASKLKHRLQAIRFT